MKKNKKEIYIYEEDYYKIQQLKLIPKYRENRTFADMVKVIIEKFEKENNTFYTPV